MLLHVGKGMELIDHADTVKRRIVSLQLMAITSMSIIKNVTYSFTYLDTLDGPKKTYTQIILRWFTHMNWNFMNKLGFVDNILHQ